MSTWGQDLLALSADLDAVIEASPDAIIVLTPDHRIARFNPAAEAQYGYPVADTIGRDVWDFWTTDQRGDVALIDEVIGSGAVGPIVRERIRHDGSRIWVALTGVPIPGADGRTIGTHWHSRDVTAERLMRAELREQVDRFNAAFEASPIGMLVASFRGEHAMVNPAMCRLVGYRAEEMIRMRGLDFRHPDEAQDIRDTVRSLQEGLAASGVRRRRLRHKDGHYIWVEETIAVLERDPQSPYQLLVQCRDVSHDVEQERRNQFLMDHDHLTGLLNRRAFEQIVLRHHTSTRHGEGRRWSGGRGALLLIDLDGFKQHNDTYGHAAGDQILAAVAEPLARELRQGDVAARIGGDEFAVFLRDSGGQAADQVAQRLLVAIAQATTEASESSTQVTASIGLADFDETSGVDEITHRADQAMYRAKEQGRNRWSR